ncbi:phosphotransferase [Luedemannella helvata]|uniref:Aminoglycoside phosphotransferase domain-containing protein n=1 Tax=Luedemannella helvata TaxID=349315 RepID=A0ABN2K8H2_9ACTN
MARHTHDLTVAGDLVTKRYTSWERDEHRREWTALVLVHEHAPDLVPRPMRADLDANPPAVTMTRLPGEPLSGGELGPALLRALADALRTLWTVPHDDVPPLGPWRDDLGFAARLTSAPRPKGDLLAAAYDASLAWWDGPDPALLRCPPPGTVLGHRDPNLLNYLWDGRRVRIVDFEDAAVSDPATEIALLLEHLSARDAGAERLLDRLPVDPTRLRAARRVWAMFWLTLLLPGGPAAARNPPGTADAQARRLLRLLDA